MGTTNNHNYSIETIFEVVTLGGRLPSTLLHKTPAQFTAADEYELTKIFDGMVTDPNFKNYMRRAIDKIDDREDVARSREEPEPQLNLFDDAVELVEEVALGAAVGSLLGGDDDSSPPSSPEWEGEGGEFSGAGASGDFGGSDE